MFILMKTVIFICRGRHEGIANVETYSDRQGQTRTDRDMQGQKKTSRDIQGQTRTDRDIQGQTRTSRDKRGQTGTSMEKQGQKRNDPVCPCLVPSLSLLVPACLCVSLLVSVCPWAVPGIDWHNW